MKMVVIALMRDNIAPSYLVFTRGRLNFSMISLKLWTTTWRAPTELLEGCVLRIIVRMWEFGNRFSIIKKKILLVLFEVKA